jgi:hypothetical protein
MSKTHIPYTKVHPHVMVTDLATTLSDKWVGWDNDTVILSLPWKLTPEETDKVLAVKAFLTNPLLPGSSGIVFEKCVLAFANEVVIADQPQSPEIEEVYYGVTQMRKIYPAIEFTGEVPGYVAAVAKYRDVHVLPKTLNFASSMLQYMYGRKDFDFTSSEELFTKIEQTVTTAGLTEDVVKLFDHPVIGSSVKTVTGCILYDPTNEPAAT